MADMFELLRNKEIIAILDGDKQYGNYSFDDGTFAVIAMPYLSGKALCDISSLFGLPKTYSWGGSNQSRWQYLDELLLHCIKNGRCSDLLAYLFANDKFAQILSGHNANEVNAAYKEIIRIIIDKINGILLFGGNELVVNGESFTIHKIGTSVKVVAPKIKSIDREYIKSISFRAMQDVEQKNFDSAITKSRTLLEETFCYVIEKKGVSPSESGDMGKLYKQVRDLYNMHTDSSIDKRINTLLSGLNNIVSSIAEMRNKDSDAHGVGEKRINIDEHHARLFVNAAMTMANFVLSVQVNAAL